MSYKCVNCGAVKGKGSEVYLVENPDSNLSSPTCSRECAIDLKKKQIKILQDKIRKIRSASTKKEIW